MDKSVKVFLVILVIVLVGLPLLGKLARESRSEPPSPDTPAAAPAPAPATPPATPAPDQPMTQKARPQYSPPPQPPRPAPARQGQRKNAPPKRPSGNAPPLLNAQNLANSVWQMKIDQYNVQVQLFAGGSARATAAGLPMAIEGSWSVQGAHLVVSAMGKTERAKIVGDQIIVNGVPAKRIR